MTQKHKFSDLIKAWADGATIQFRNQYCQEWEDLDPVGGSYTPAWFEGCEYRVKPEPKYPETRMSGAELDAIFMRDPGSCAESMVVVANTVIRRAIQDGDVVLPEGKA